MVQRLITRLDTYLEPVMGGGGMEITLTQSLGVYLRQLPAPTTGLQRQSQPTGESKMASHRDGQMHVMDGAMGTMIQKCEKGERSLYRAVKERKSRNSARFSIETSMR